MITRRQLATLTAATALLPAAVRSAGAAQEALVQGETEKIAETAFVYGFPMVMNYAVFYEYFIDKSSSQYKAPFNQIDNIGRVATPQDTAIVTPNSDTPYSFVGLDLRAEPVVLCNPEMEKSRYFSVQLIDMYTFNYGYCGTRTTGNGAGCFMIAGPQWKGETPAGIAKVFRSETDFSLAVFRTQLFGPADIDNVRKIQAGYRAMTLSAFEKKPAPQAAPAIDWPKINKQMAAEDPFGYLAFLLQFCPPTGPAAVDAPLRTRFARIGIEAGKPFSPDQLTAEQKAELETAEKRALVKIRQKLVTIGTNENGWLFSTHLFGNRQMIAGDWLLRAAAAMGGIYGNNADEALYPLLATRPDAATGNYTLTFAPGQLPPVNAFWSVTMYDGKTQLLVANALDRYLINSPMLPGLKKGSNGSLTLYLQKDSPGADKEPNWIPAPDGPMYVVMRLYWPKQSALNGSWKPPPVQRSN